MADETRISDIIIIISIYDNVQCVYEGVCDCLRPNNDNNVLELGYSRMNAFQWDLVSPFFLLKLECVSIQ